MMVEKTLPFRTYKNTLDTDKTARRGIPIILSFHQEIFSISNTKDCLASYNDKMKMLNQIDCEPFGFINTLAN